MKVIYKYLKPYLPFLLLKILHCKSSLALFGGLLHAVAIGAIARSTGQDIIRGSFALPMLSAMLLLLYCCYLRGRTWHYILLGVVAFAAFSTWDLSLGTDHFHREQSGAAG